MRGVARTFGCASESEQYLLVAYFQQRNPKYSSGAFGSDRLQIIWFYIRERQTAAQPKVV